MKATLFRVAAASALLYGSTILGAMALSSAPAWPGETVMPPIIVEPPAPVQPGAEGSVTVPMVGRSKCAPRVEIVEFLESKYDEVQAGFGLASPELAFEVFASPKGSWTILRSMINGRSCIIGEGLHWSGSKAIRGPQV